jgi:hypothetical protein
LAIIKSLADFCSVAPETVVAIGVVGSVVASADNASVVGATDRVVAIAVFQTFGADIASVIAHLRRARIDSGLAIVDGIAGFTAVAPESIIAIGVESYIIAGVGIARIDCAGDRVIAISIDKALGTRLGGLIACLPYAWTDFRLTIVYDVAGFCAVAPDSVVANPTNGIVIANADIASVVGAVD